MCTFIRFIVTSIVFGGGVSLAIWAIFEFLIKKVVSYPLLWTVGIIMFILNTLWFFNLIKLSEHTDDEFPRKLLT